VLGDFRYRRRLVPEAANERAHREEGPRRRAVCADNAQRFVGVDAEVKFVGADQSAT